MPLPRERSAQLIDYRSRGRLGAVWRDATARLLRIPGVGTWTAAEVTVGALGDPDAVSVGDFHLASVVGYALTGRKLDDAGMLAELACYAPQRHRAVRYVELSGVAPERHGPRFAGRDYRAM